MTTLRFTATIQIRGINPYVAVSEARASILQPDWRKPMPVLVRINGAPTNPWRINMMPAGGGSFYLYLHGDVRKASSTKVGDSVNVEVMFDIDYQNGPQHTMPEQLLAVLTENSDAKANWDKLSPSRQKEVLRYLAGLKSPEALTRNVGHALRALSGGKEHWMGRDWQNGS